MSNLYAEADKQGAAALDPVVELVDHPNGKSPDQAFALQPVAKPDPMHLMQMLVERGADADQLGKMMDLQERWSKARAIEAYNASMAACQKEMPTVVHDAQNLHTKKNYATLENVNKIIKPVYTKHGFALSFSTDDCQREGYYRIVCTCRHAEGHETLHRLDLPLDGQGAKGGNSSMNAVQAGGSTISYGRRYITLMVFNVTVGDEDDDATNGATVKITDDELGNLNDLIMEKGVDLPKFLKWANIPSLDQMPRSGYAKAMDLLRKKSGK